MKWKKKSNFKDLHFNLFIKQCMKCIMYIIWSVEKNTKSKTPKVVRTKNGRTMLFSSCVLCDNYKVDIYQRARS